MTSQTIRISLMLVYVSFSIFILVVFLSFCAS